MIEVTGDLWTFRHSKKIVRCITTNGFVKADGRAVMGKGCAWEAAERFPQLPAKVGEHIRKNGNVVGLFPLLESFTLSDTTVLTFPVKHVWWDRADLKLIQQSADALCDIACGVLDTVYILARPGCGNGGLTWEQVKPVIDFLPDNVLVITKG